MLLLRVFHPNVYSMQWKNKNCMQSTLNGLVNNKVQSRPSKVSNMIPLAAQIFVPIAAYQANHDWYDLLTYTPKLDFDRTWTIESSIFRYLKIFYSNFFGTNADSGTFWAFSDQYILTNWKLCNPQNIMPYCSLQWSPWPFKDYQRSGNKQNECV